MHFRIALLIFAEVSFQIFGFVSLSSILLPYDIFFKFCILLSTVSARNVQKIVVYCAYLSFHLQSKGLDDYLRNMRAVNEEGSNDDPSDSGNRGMDHQSISEKLPSEIESSGSSSSVSERFPNEKV